MRFTNDQWILCIVTAFLLCVANLFTCGEISIVRAVVVLMVCYFGIRSGLRRFRKVSADSKQQAPVSYGLSGIARVALILGMFELFLGLGIGYRSICTRTFVARTDYGFGVLVWRETYVTEQAHVLRNRLKFNPAEEHWVTVSIGIADSMPSRYYPHLWLEPSEINDLYFVKPIERTHVLFLLDNPLDIKCAYIRKRFILELRHNSDITYWDSHEYLFQPLKTKEDVAALVKANGKYRQLSEGDLRELVYRLGMSELLAAQP